MNNFHTYKTVKVVPFSETCVHPTHLPGLFTYLENTYVSTVCSQYYQCESSILFHAFILQKPYHYANIWIDKSFERDMYLREDLILIEKRFKSGVQKYYLLLSWIFLFFYN